MAADERGNLAVVLCHLVDNWAGKGRLEIDFYFYTCEIRGCLNTGHLLPVLGEGDKWHLWRTRIYQRC